MQPKPRTDTNWKFLCILSEAESLRLPILVKTYPELLYSSQLPHILLVGCRAYILRLYERYPHSIITRPLKGVSAALHRVSDRHVGASLPTSRRLGQDNNVHSKKEMMKIQCWPLLYHRNGTALCGLERLHLAGPAARLTTRGESLPLIGRFTGFVSAVGGRGTCSMQPPCCNIADLRSNSGSDEV